MPTKAPAQPKAINARVAVPATIYITVEATDAESDKAIKSRAIARILEASDSENSFSLESDFEAADRAIIYAESDEPSTHRRTRIVDISEDEEED